MSRRLISPVCDHDADGFHLALDDLLFRGNVCVCGVLQARILSAKLADDFLPDTKVFQLGILFGLMWDYRNPVV